MGRKGAGKRTEQKEEAATIQSDLAGSPGNFAKEDGQYRIRTCDPFRVKEVRYRYANCPRS